MVEVKLQIGNEEMRYIHNNMGSFAIPEIESFLASLSINRLKEKSTVKNDITIQIEDPKTFLSPILGFSIKSQLGSPSTLLNSSNTTKFTFVINDIILSSADIARINNTTKILDKITILTDLGANLEFEGVDHPVFKSNLQTIDYNFDRMLAFMLLNFYSNTKRNESTISKLVENLTIANPIGYDLAVNPQMYQLIMKRFLLEYALGMRAGEVWTRNYQANGGYLVIRKDGELICYHFYFIKSLEDYLFTNTKLDTPSTGRHDFAEIYNENGLQKIKLNLQIRFIK